MPIATPRAMFRILSVTCLLTRKALHLIIIPDWRMCLMLSGFAYIYIILMSFSASNIIVTVVVPRVCVCVSVRSFLPPRTSRPRNMGTYVFTVTQKTLLYIRIIIVIFVENASFRSYGVICLPRMSLSTPEPQKRILTESTQRGHDITIRDSKIKKLRSEVTAHSFTFFVCISPI